MPLALDYPNNELGDCCRVFTLRTEKPQSSLRAKDEFSRGNSLGKIEEALLGMQQTTLEGVDMIVIQFSLDGLEARCSLQC